MSELRTTMTSVSNVCAVCAQITQGLVNWAVDSLPNANQLLRPRISHDAQQLFQGLLLHPLGLSSGDTVAGICPGCLLDLRRNLTPTMSMANGLWLGDVPNEMKGLSSVERYLILRTSPLELSVIVCCSEVSMAGMTETVYELVFSPHVILGPALPLDVGLLRELVHVRGRDGAVQLHAYHEDLRVRRDRVRAALGWLVRNNGAYASTVVCEASLALLPMDGLLWDFVGRIISLPRVRPGTS